MSTQVQGAAQHMKPETVNSLRELVCGLQDSTRYHKEAADKIDDDYVAGVLRNIADARKQICENIGGFITLADGKLEENGTFGGTLRSIWTAFRAGSERGRSGGRID